MGRVSCNELLVTTHETTRCHDPLTIKTSQSKRDKSKLKLHSQTYEQFKFGKRAPSIGSESSFFQAAIQKGKVNCHQAVNPLRLYSLIAIYQYSGEIWCLSTRTASHPTGRNFSKSLPQKKKNFQPPPSDDLWHKNIFFCQKRKTNTKM